MLPFMLVLLGGLFLTFYVRSIVLILHCAWLDVWQKNDGHSQVDTHTDLIYQDVDGEAVRTKQVRRGRCLLSLGKSHSLLYITPIVFRWKRQAG
jgi:hypothetical protein